jgi:aminopeptidase YwaD
MRTMLRWPGLAGWLCMLLLAVACLSRPTAAGRALQQEQPAPGSVEFDGRRAFAHVQALAQTIGPRVSGTPGEAQAVDYIAGQLKAFGYDVEVMHVAVAGTPFRTATVSLGGGGVDITGLALAGSAAGRATGEAVYVGLGDAAGIGEQDLRGKVAVAGRGVLRFGEKLQNVRDRGAVALVIVNNVPGLLRGALGVEAEIPVVGIAQEDGERILAAVQQHEALTVDVPDVGRIQAMNVIGRAAPGGHCDVIAGGHHDTVPGTPGANDNASGTATVLELARAFAADGLDPGLCFVTFGAEESGLHGSQALAARLASEGALPRLMVNLDVTGIGASVHVIGSPEVVQRALELARQLGIPAEREGIPANAGSDHVSFARVGVPVIFLTSGDFTGIHSPTDVVERVDPDELDRVGNLAYAVIKTYLQPGGTGQR